LAPVASEAVNLSLFVDYNVLDSPRRYSRLSRSAGGDRRCPLGRFTCNSTGGDFRRSLYNFSRDTANSSASSPSSSTPWPSKQRRRRKVTYDLADLGGTQFTKPWHIHRARRKQANVGSRPSFCPQGNAADSPSSHSSGEGTRRN
jgi:hypothetical protein